MKSTQIQKILMALTGFFLCIFLVIHLLGNLQLLLPAEKAKTSFNWYSHFLSGNILIKIIEILLFVSVAAHIVVCKCCSSYCICIDINIECKKSKRTEICIRPPWHSK